MPKRQVNTPREVGSSYGVPYLRKHDVTRIGILMQLLKDQQHAVKVRNPLVSESSWLNKPVTRYLSPLSTAKRVREVLKMSPKRSGWS